DLVAQRVGAGPQRVVDVGAFGAGGAHDVGQVTQLHHVDVVGEVFEFVPRWPQLQLRAEQRASDPGEDPAVADRRGPVEGFDGAVSGADLVRGQVQKRAHGPGELAAG